MRASCSLCADHGRMLSRANRKNPQDSPLCACKIGSGSDLHLGKWSGMSEKSCLLNTMAGMHPCNRNLFQKKMKQAQGNGVTEVKTPGRQN